MSEREQWEPVRFSAYDDLVCFFSATVCTAARNWSRRAPCKPATMHHANSRKTNSQSKSYNNAESTTTPALRLVLSVVASHAAMTNTSTTHSGHPQRSSGARLRTLVATPRGSICSFSHIQITYYIIYTVRFTGKVIVCK